MLTNLLSVIRGVTNKGTCIVELGQHADSSHPVHPFCICGTTISAELNQCNACWESMPSADWAALLNWDDRPVDDADLILPALDDARPLYLDDCPLDVELLQVALDEAHDA